MFSSFKKTKYLSLFLLISLFTFGIFSLTQSKSSSKPTSEGFFNPKVDWFYLKTSNDITVSMGKRSSKLPTVRYEKDTDYLQFSMYGIAYSDSTLNPRTNPPHWRAGYNPITPISSTTAVTLETNVKTPNEPVLFYRGIDKDIDVIYKITNIPLKVKEEIVLKKFLIPNSQFPNNDSIGNSGINSLLGNYDLEIRNSNLTFLFSAETTAKPVKQKDGSIAFFDKNDNYLFQLDKPFMIDANGNRSEDVSIEIVPLITQNQNSKPKSFNFQFKNLNSIFKYLKLPVPNFKTQNRHPMSVLEAQEYTIVLTADSNWLSTAVYPVIIDPTITHNADSNFSGQMNRIADSDTTTSTQLETSYGENANDPYTVLNLHFNEANGSTNIKDYASTTRVITANANASTTNYVTQLGMGNSGAFDGTGDYLTVPDSEDWNFGSGDFTIDFWVNSDLTEQSNDIIELFGQGNNDAGSNYMSIDLRSINQSNPGKLSFYSNVSGVAVFNILSSALTANVWYHVAAIKQGSIYSLYLNGTLQGTATYATALPNYTSSVYISKRNYSDVYGYLKGYLDSLRIIKGRALTPEEIKAAASRRPYAVYTSSVLDASASVQWDTLNWTEGGVNTGNGEQPYSTNSLVAQWDFNETSGTTATSSTSGSCQTCAGTLTNFASIASQDQAAGTGWTANNKRWGAGALMFDGSNDYVEVVDNNNLDIISAITLSAWIKPSGVGGSFRAIIEKGNIAGNSLNYELQLSNASTPTLRFQLYNGGFRIADSNTAIQNGVWTYVAVTFDGSTVKHYINGNLDKSASFPYTMTADNSNLLIGKRSDVGSQFGGIIDSAAIYSRALSASEILSNYNIGNIELQTRTGATSDPNDGTWEAWKPTTGETQLLSMDSDAANWRSDIMASTTIATSTESTIKMEGTGSLKVELGKASTTANTVALWHFEETGTTTGTTLYDSTANAKNGTTNGTPAVINGIFGKARSFDGVDDYVNIGSSVTSAVDNFTLSAWFKVPNMTTTERVAMMVIQNGNNSGGYGVGFSSDGTNGYIGGIYNGIVWQTFSTNGLTGASGLYNLSPSPDVWHHIALVRNNGTTLGYLNGVQYPVYYPTTAPSTPANAAAVGKGATTAAGVAGDVYFKGSIDEPVVLSRALSADEIAETYRMGANHHLTRQVSVVDLSAPTKLAFNIAADRPGTYLEAMLGESDYANYELASSTLALSTATVLYIKGDEIASSTSIKDSSFSGKAITANGDAKISGVGKIGNSVYFDGTGDYLSIPDSDDWNFGSGDFGIDFWVKTNNTSGLGIIGQTNVGGNGNSSFIIRTRESASLVTLIRISTDGTNWALALGTTVALDDNIWHHVVIVRNGTTVILYIDGVNVASGTLSGAIYNSTTALAIGRPGEVTSLYYNGYLDEVRVIKGTALTADQIRQAYEYGLRSHQITIDFGATLQSSDLISSATDYNFSITATTSGLSATTSGLYLGDKIVVKENLGGTEYKAQGTVNSINNTTGAITVPSWDSGSTFPSGNGYSPNATVFKWQREYFDLTGAATTTRNAITNLTLRPTNGAEGRTVYLDDFRYNTNYLTASSSSAITSSNGRYLQYRAIFTSWDSFVSPFLSAFNTLYTSTANMFAPGVGISGDGILMF